MLTLAVLLQAAGLIFTFTLGPAGYAIGPACIVGGGLLYRREKRRREELIRNPQPVQPPVPRRPGWQRFLIGFTGFAVVSTAMFALVWKLTSGMADAADAFFVALRDGDVAAARANLAQDFNASTSDEQLREFVKNSALSDYQSASWSSRSVENSRGYLEGTIETRTGGSIPMRVDLIKESGGWKIFSLHKPAAGIHTDDEKNRPSELDQVRLVRTSTAQFVGAVEHHDFAELHRQISGVWQRQITPEQLQEAFKGFSESGANLSALAGLQPTIDAAAYDSDGAFVIEGSYPTWPHTFLFRYRYVFEGVDWKLVGMRANFK